MKLLKQAVLAVIVALAGTGVAGAQVLGLGTAKGGTTKFVGQEVAKIVSQNTDLQMRSQAFASSGQYGMRVNAGALDFGVSNVIETNYLYRGRELTPKPQDNLRMVMVFYSLPVTFFASKQSGITKPEQLKQARMPVGWTSQPLGAWLWRGFFANHGMDYDSIDGVPVTAMPRQWDMFGQNQIDASFAIFGAAFIEDLVNRAGGATYLDANDDPQAVARMREILPYAVVSTDRHPQHDLTVKNISYDFVMYSSASVPEDVVYKVVKAVHENPGSIEQIYKKKIRYAVEVGVPYHPGAIKYYKEVGLWPPKE
jgi:TRAP transporter TAXI family solute receptor